MKFYKLLHSDEELRKIVEDYYTKQLIIAKEIIELHKIVKMLKETELNWQKIEKLEQNIKSPPFFR